MRDVSAEAFCLIVLIYLVGMIVLVFYCVNYSEKKRKEMMKEHTGAGKANSYSASSSYSSKGAANARALKDFNVPNDAHDAVEMFANLACYTYRLINQMAPDRDRCFYRILILLKQRTEMEYGCAKFSFDFDWNMDGFHRTFGINLGDGFKIDGDTVIYESNSIDNLESWLVTGAEWRKTAGLPLKDAADPIAATVLNNCSDAYVDLQNVSSDNGWSFLVTFKFR
ncbi:MAG: hypothetical protein IJA77_02650 [Clostridia bacterium]|nr:hypothetical protein [Clostridia bacterium]